MGLDRAVRPTRTHSHTNPVADYLPQQIEHKWQKHWTDSGAFEVSEDPSRIPVDVVWADGADPMGMHNLYTQLYNEAVFDVLQERRGAGDAVLFARSATVGVPEQIRQLDELRQQGLLGDDQFHAKRDELLARM